MVSSPQQLKFGQDKQDRLTAQCRSCKVRNWCNGGCPKDRFALSRDGEAGHNYLCPGLELFFTHTGPAFEKMAQLLRQGSAPAKVMASIAAADKKRGPYAACPCGSGKKFRFCHGDKAPPSAFSAVSTGVHAGQPVGHPGLEQGVGHGQHHGPDKDPDQTEAQHAADDTREDQQQR